MRSNRALQVRGIRVPFVVVAVANNMRSEVDPSSSSLQHEQVRKPTVFSVDFDRQFPLSDRLVIYDFWYAVGLLVRLTEKSENQHFYSLGDRSKKGGLVMSD